MGRNIQKLDDCKLSSKSSGKKHIKSILKYLMRSGKSTTFMLSLLTLFPPHLAWLLRPQAWHAWPQLWMGCSEIFSMKRSFQCWQDSDQEALQDQYLEVWSDGKAYQNKNYFHSRRQAKRDWSNWATNAYLTRFETKMSFHTWGSFVCWQQTKKSKHLRQREWSCQSKQVNW